MLEVEPTTTLQRPSFDDTREVVLASSANIVEATRRVLVLLLEPREWRWLECATGNGGVGIRVHVPDDRAAAAVVVQDRLLLLHLSIRVPTVPSQWLSPPHPGRLAAPCRACVRVSGHVHVHGE